MRTFVRENLKWFITTLIALLAILVPSCLFIIYKSGPLNQEPENDKLVPTTSSTENNKGSKNKQTAGDNSTQIIIGDITIIFGITREQFEIGTQRMVDDAILKLLEAQIDSDEHRRLKEDLADKEYKLLNPEEAYQEFLRRGWGANNTLETYGEYFTIEHIEQAQKELQNGTTNKAEAMFDWVIQNSKNPQQVSDAKRHRHTLLELRTQFSVKPEQGSESTRKNPEVPPISAKKDTDDDSSSKDPEACDCKGKINQLTLRYNGTSAEEITITRSPYGVEVFGPKIVNPGELITITDP